MQGGGEKNGPLFKQSFHEKVCTQRDFPHKKRQKLSVSNVLTPYKKEPQIYSLQKKEISDTYQMYPSIAFGLKKLLVLLYRKSALSLGFTKYDPEKWPSPIDPREVNIPASGDKNRHLLSKEDIKYILKGFLNFERTSSKSCTFFISFAYQNLAVLCVKRP